MKNNTVCVINTIIIERMIHVDGNYYFRVNDVKEGIEWYKSVDNFNEYLNRISYIDYELFEQLEKEYRLQINFI